MLWTSSCGHNTDMQQPNWLSFAAAPSNPRRRSLKQPSTATHDKRGSCFLEAITVDLWLNSPLPPPSFQIGQKNNPKGYDEQQQWRQHSASWTSADKPYCQPVFHAAARWIWDIQLCSYVYIPFEKSVKVNNHKNIFFYLQDDLCKLV